MRLRRLTPSERIVAWRLVSGRLVRYEELNTAIYHKAEDVSPNSIKVIVCRLRDALECLGVSVINQHGQGWEVPRGDLDQLRSLLATEIADYVSFPYTPKIKRFKNSDAREDLTV